MYSKRSHPLAEMNVYTDTSFRSWGSFQSLTWTTIVHQNDHLSPFVAPSIGCEILPISICRRNPIGFAQSKQAAVQIISRRSIALGRCKTLLIRTWARYKPWVKAERAACFCYPPISQGQGVVPERFTVEVKRRIIHIPSSVL